jgi:hypothetical protein
VFLKKVGKMKTDCHGFSCQRFSSNVAHLSNQFKKVTGLTPSFFHCFNGTEQFKMISTIIKSGYEHGL